MKLTLHEAIAVVLLNKENYTASQEEIAREINERRLYIRKDGEPVPGYQIMQRTELANGNYHHLFDYQSKDRITLRLRPKGS
ncbi:hypothetical protein GWK08_08015 [Leptobacterium flavescens]|uniref:HTH HARE-type domain-containing protein n=1 Tax=Leptobacterium flavescens TaxID=472055 RepID=A0A6P0UNF9_9FLAO|nr:hypothetical protein [Leptobacterium flavescens]NER13379.1 hypothetical protein [Leptobacterium flavescens]